MKESTHWWRRARPARAAWTAVWIVALLAWMPSTAIILAAPTALPSALRDAVQNLYLFAFVPVVIASVVDLMTCRARGANVDFALLRAIGTPLFGIGTGFVIGGGLSASGVLDGGIPDEDGWSFLVVGIVLSAAGAFMFASPDRLQRSEERRKRN